MKRCIGILVSIAMLFVLCSCNNNENNRSESIISTEEELTNPGEYLSNSCESLEINGISFSLSSTYDELKQVFGNDLVVYFPDDEKVQKSSLFSVSGSLYNNEQYFGTLTFLLDSNFNDGKIVGIIQEFPYSAETKTVSAFRYSGDGQVVTKDVELNPDNFVVSVNDFTSGISTRTDFQQEFGDGIERDRYDGYVCDEYTFEDGVMRLVYDDGIFCGFSIALQQ